MATGLMEAPAEEMLEYIVDETVLPFIMLPKSIIKCPGITHESLRFYCWLKMVCGDGQPDANVTLQEQMLACQLTLDELTSARELLEDLGFISTLQDGEHINITILFVS